LENIGKCATGKTEEFKKTMNQHTIHVPLQMASQHKSGRVFPRPVTTFTKVTGGRISRRALVTSVRRHQTAMHSRLRGLLALAALLLVAIGVQAQGVFAARNVGSLSAAQSVTVTASSSVVGSVPVSKVEVLTSGASGLDFAKVVATSTCEPPTATLTAGATCTESVTFKPEYPGLRLGAVVLFDVNGNVMGMSYLSGVGQGGLDVLVPGNTVTFAGVLKETSSTTNGIAATTADLKQPASVALDGAGNLYIADSAHNEVRMVCFSDTSATIAGLTCPQAGFIIDIAGTGETGYAGDGTRAWGINVQLNNPSGLALDGAGNLFIADTGNNVIREVSAATGFISTVVGSLPGTPGYGGDGTVATTAGVELDGPQGVTVDASGNLYIADTNNQRIRRVDAVTDIITTAAGNGTPSGQGDGKGKFGGDNGPANAAELSLPYAVAFDLSGDMYIPDSANNRIRMVQATGGVLTATSTISTVVGTAIAGSSCPALEQVAASNLNAPEGVAIDPAGNIYISDTGDGCVRKENIANGNVVALAVQGQNAIAGGDLVSVNAFAPDGIILDGLGNVYYADYYDMLVSEIQSNTAVLNFQATPIRQGNQSAPQAQMVENDGNASSNLTAVTPDQNAAINAAGTSCIPTPFALTEDADCNISAEFAPSLNIVPATLPANINGNVDVVNNSVNSPLDIVLAGNALPVNSTDISLTSAPNPAEFGTAVTLTATVTTGPNTGALTGTVTFSDTLNGVTVQLGAPVTVNAAGVATFTTSTLAVGVHTLSAVYNGDPAHFASQPGDATETIYEDTKMTLTALPASPSLLGQSVTFTATVTVTDGGAFPLNGSVTFTDSLEPLANNTIALVNGVATYTTAALLQGINVITATYTPTTPPLIQTSMPVTISQDVVANSPLTLTSAPNPSILGTTVTFTAAIPTTGNVAATGNVNIVIVPAGQVAPTYPLTVTLGGNPATGGAGIATLPVGTYTATATYAGDVNYAAATANLAIPQVVTKVPTTTTLAAAPNPALAGQPVQIIATVAPTSGKITPSGTVTFTDTFNGQTVTLGPATLNAAGTASLTISTLAAGTHSIVGTYGGDADNATSTSAPLSLVINLATTTVVVTAAPDPAIVDTTITFTATVTGNAGTPTGTVTFTANPGGGGAVVPLGTAPLNAAGVATVLNATLAPGTYQIVGVYNGDPNDASATSAAVTETVTLIPTTTSLSTATSGGVDSQTTLIAIVQNSGAVGPGPTGTVTFMSGTTNVGAAPVNANGVATLTPNLQVGTYNIVAMYSGDALHSPSTSAAVSYTSVGSYTLTVTPSTVTIPTTQNAQLTVTLASVDGFTDTIGLGCASLPAGVNCHFANIDVPLAANGTATVQLTIDTNNPLGGGATAMNKQSGERKLELAGLFLPFSVFLGWILWRFRKRHAGAWSIVLILALSGAALLTTGCIGITQSSAKPGTYTIQVIGVGANTNVTEYQAVTLNITQ
jgi:sugar lactone lactonase YvrE